MNVEEVLALQTASSRLGISFQSLQKLIGRGDIEAVRRTVILQSELERYVKTLQSED